METNNNSTCETQVAVTNTESCVGKSHERRSNKLGVW
jgi:hypothetical protein